MSDVVVLDSGTEVHLSVDDTVTARLAENGGTGYQWELVAVASVLRLVSDEFRLPDPLRPGAAGVREVVLAATAPGRGDVVLNLRAVWETDPVDRFTVRVVVR